MLGIHTQNSPKFNCKPYYWVQLHLLHLNEVKILEDWQYDNYSEELDLKGFELDWKVLIL